MTAREVFIEIVRDALDNKAKVKEITKTFSSSKRARVELIEKLDDILEEVDEFLMSKSSSDGSSESESSDESSSSESSKES
jgi:hypothetical protein